MAFTGSDIPVALAMYDEIVLGEGNLHIKEKIPANTLRAIIENQTVDLRPISTTDPCLETDAWFYRTGASNLVYDGTAPDAGQGCDLVTGPELASEKIRLANNFHIKSAFTVDSPRCNNASEASMEIAKGLANCFATNRRTINNKYAIPLLANSLQANQSDAAVVGGIVDEGVTPNLLKMDPSAFSAEGAYKFELLATNNYFSTPVMVTGGNFYTNNALAQFEALDDDKRSRRALFGATTMYFDQLNLDTASATYGGITDPVTYIFDPNVMAFWSTQLYDTQVTMGDNPQQAADPSTNYYVFSVQDQLMPEIYHNVEMEWKCKERQDKSGRKVWGWTFNVTTMGHLSKAPDGFNWPVDETVAATQVLTGVLGVVAKV